VVAQHGQVIQGLPFILASLLDALALIASIFVINYLQRIEGKSAEVELGSYPTELESVTSETSCDSQSIRSD